MRLDGTYLFGAAIIALCIIFGTGCGTSAAPDGYPVPGPTVTVTPDPAPTVTVTPSPAPLSTQDQINALVASENAYRESLGETSLAPGLSCQVVLVSGGQWLSSSSPGYNSSQGVLTTTGTTYTFNSNDGGGFNQGNANGNVAFTTLPPAIQPLFENQNFRIICSGEVVVITTDYYSFTLSSDDGSILTIDGTQVINNDGNHSIVTKTGSKELRQGVHTFSLQYAQSGSGQFALVLNADGSAIDPSVWYH